MDNLAHTVVGAALGRAVADRHVRGAALIGAVAANAPDWTELFTGFFAWTRPDYLVLHRGVTHSLAAGALEIVGLTVALGAGARWWSRRRGRAPPRWRWLALCIAVTLLSHLFLDWQGSYGWRPFLPWDGTWWYGDWVAIADPFFWLLPVMAFAWGAQRHWAPLAMTVGMIGGITAIIVVYARRSVDVASWMLVLYGALCVMTLVGWVRYWFGPVGRQRAAALAIVALAAYAGAQGVVVQFKRKEIRQVADQRFGPAATFAALTQVGRPFTWDRVVASQDTVAGDGWSIPRNLDRPAVQRALRETPEGRAMRIFARFLAADVDSTGAAGESIVYLRDARYARSGRNNWAVLRVRIESGGLSACGVAPGSDVPPDCDGQPGAVARPAPGPNAAAGP